MKSILTLMLVAISSVLAYAESGAPEVVVRVFDGGAIHGNVLPFGELIAARILATAGVRLRWERHHSSPETASPAEACGANGPAQTIDLRFRYSTPENYTPGALAEALPFADGGIRIVVFYDRVAGYTALLPGVTGNILGHVLAHEIGHMLLQVVGHAETGLMKARWTAADYGEMGVRNLDFTSWHAALIQSNLARRCSPSAETMLAAVRNQ